ncbi:MAG: hypothetical protein G01um101438_699 [Parcubacteria group bacterium Gr01-1014_38]|nr:MAG: hypothetical protein G01um101438_699 [Parcubacteria group bacterium Gr01-1014_38]
MTKTTLAHELLNQLFSLLLSIGFLLFALHLMAKVTGMGEKSVKRLVGTLLEALTSVIVFPFKLLVWLLKKFL